LLVVDVSGGTSHERKLVLATPASHAAAAPTTAAPTTTALPTTTTTTRPPAVLPDGSPLPVLVVFNGSTITLAGSVPSAADAAQLVALAEANSKTSASVINHLVVDERVPASVGVRVVEMNAVRFAEGSSTVTADYAPELNRVIALMRAMPWVTAVVIGHADQTGAPAPNLQLSQARADAVIDYLTSQGISPDRLSGQGVGARDPLSTQDTTIGWALNRRTEFVFHGLFISKAR
jgi:outer membrane protein OmpA-like peptidoglycan-associated protein